MTGLLPAGLAEGLGFQTMVLIACTPTRGLAVMDGLAVSN